MSIAILGGSGLYDIQGLETVQSHDIQTPYGSPSGSIQEGKLSGRTVFFLARHGAGHKLLPHEVNHQANIWALKSLGVQSILSFSAVGSLKEEIHPCDFVIVDQYVDHTKRPAQSFFGKGAVAHVSLAEPTCKHLADQLYTNISELKKKSQTIHPTATYINIEGPQFSTKAESNLYRSWGMDVIGMTNFCEARLAREAEICYSTIAMVTDYDCWHPDHDAVTVDQVITNLHKNADFAKEIIQNSISKLSTECPYGCQNALKQGLLTPTTAIPESTKKDLEPIIRKYC
ncbi:MAG: S-methyl-5'-thioadenosine phosphorylase [Lentisphaerales bacterium]|nr:S-methyl-5'-thioadenosine phosphorylase [Lentisphaerales bacterium]